MARSTSAPAPAAADIDPPPPADHTIELQAEIARLRQQQADQAAEFRRRVAELQTTADAAGAEARALKAREQQVRAAAQEEIESARRADAGTDTGRHWRVRCPWDPLNPTMVLAAPTKADAGVRYATLIGANAIHGQLDIRPTDDPIGPTYATHRWVPFPAPGRWQPKDGPAADHRPDPEPVVHAYA